MNKSLTVTTPSDREILIAREFDAPRSLVFDCHTKPELITRWLMGPGGWILSVCDVDLRVGGTFRYVWRHPVKSDMGMRGLYREIVAPERLVHTELFDVDWTGGETLVTMVLTEQAGKTAMTMTVLYASIAARDGALKSGMTGGMDDSYARLDEVMASLGDAP